MDERVSQVLSEMRDIAGEARTKYGALTAEQLNWRPSAEGWSVAQCLDHLILSNTAFKPEFEKLAAGQRRNSFWENWSPLSGFFGGLLIKSLKNDSKKFKAPSKDIVPPSNIEPDIVERFFSNIDEVSDSIKRCEAADRQRTVLTSPFLKLMTYRLDDAYTALIEHTRRHMRQADRVMSADGFPQ